LQVLYYEDGGSFIQAILALWETLVEDWGFVRSYLVVEDRPILDARQHQREAEWRARPFLFAASKTAAYIGSRTPKSSFPGTDETAGRR